MGVFCHLLGLEDARQSSPGRTRVALVVERRMPGSEERKIPGSEDRDQRRRESGYISSGTKTPETTLDICADVVEEEEDEDEQDEEEEEELDQITEDGSDEGETGRTSPFLLSLRRETLENTDEEAEANENGEGWWYKKNKE